MTTYNASAVSDTIIAHKKGITLQQGRALRDNPIAMAEGATGAPDIATNWGDANGGVAIYDYSIDGSVTDYEYTIPADRFEYRIRALNWGTSATGSTLSIKLYGSSSGYSSLIATTGGQYAAAASAGGNGVFEVLRGNVSSNYHVIRHEHYGTSTNSVGAFGSPLAKEVLLQRATAETITKIFFVFNGGAAINLGKLFLERRLCYV